MAYVVRSRRTRDELDAALLTARRLALAAVVADWRSLYSVSAEAVAADLHALALEVHHDATQAMLEDALSGRVVSWRVLPPEAG